MTSDFSPSESAAPGAATVPTATWREAFVEFERLLLLDPDAIDTALEQLRQLNPALYPQVHTLVSADRQARSGQFMGTRPATLTGIADEPAASTLAPGDQLGPYRLVRALGQGGMGEVWLARRADGLFEVPVALKLMHLHLANSSARERFIREGRILGQLTHGNVSRLLDAGVLPTGQLYLALEYIAGQRIDVWCDDHRLDIRARVRLFLQVCEAVAHAHAHLVVHRDLKPSNILVTEEGAVKLLDFGIAKLVEDGSSATPESDLTRAGGRAMTPDFAAPEQIEGAAITVATDVYALGLILYGLLTGSRPYGVAGRASQRERERVILEVEPRSLASSMTDATLITRTEISDAAMMRATTAKNLRIELRGDLDIIVRKALKKAPKERYASVLSMAADLRNYLQDLPIAARPDTLGYRAGKFARRHGLHTPRAKILGVLVVAAVVSVMALSWQQKQERQQALDQQALKSRIASLYESGRRELLGHNEARAAVYLNEAYKLGVDTPALRYLLGNAMRLVDAQLLRIRTGAAVLKAEPSSDGTHLFSIGSDMVLREFEQLTGRAVYTAALVPPGTTTDFVAEYSPRGGLIWVDSFQSADPSKRRLRLFDAQVDAPPLELSPIALRYGTVPIPVDGFDRRVVFIDKDGSLSLVDRQEHRSHIAGDFSAATFCRDSDAILAGDASGQLTIFDAHGRKRQRFSGMRGAAISLASTADCQVIAAGSDQGIVQVWDGTSGASLMNRSHSRPIIDVKLDPTGSRLMALRADGVAIWEPRSGVLIYEAKYLNPTQDVGQMKPDGQSLVRLESGRLSVLDPETGVDLYTLDGHVGAPIAFAFGASNDRMVSGGADGTLVLWQLPKDRVAEFKQGASAEPTPEHPVAPVSFSHDGQWAFAGGADGGGGLWNARTQERSWALASGESPLGAVAFSPDDKRIAVGDGAQRLRIVDAATGQVLLNQAGMGGRFYLLEFDATGQRIAGAMAGGRVTIWDSSSGAERASFSRDEAHASAFSPDGQTFALGVDGVVKLWDLERQAYRWSASLPSEAVPRISIVRFSPDGKQLLVASMQQFAYIMDAADGRILRRVSVPASRYFAVGSFDPSGQQVALGDESKSVALWRPGDGRLLILSGHSGPIRAASFSPDGALVLSSGADGVVKFWDAGNGDLLNSFVAHDGAVKWDNAHFSPDGSQVITGGTDNVARLWSVPREQRDAQSIAARLECRVAWKINDTALLTANPDTPKCDNDRPERELASQP